jgi:hypothetical protein
MRVIALDHDGARLVVFGGKKAAVFAIAGEGTGAGTLRWTCCLTGGM